MRLIKYYNRKTNQPFSSIFKKEPEELRTILQTYKEDYGQILISTLMPNHFHILIKCLEDGSIGKYMQKILTAFSMYFNKRYSKDGHTFESKYKYRKIENEYDLRNTIDYIYNNPVKLLDKNYKHVDLINGQYNLSKEQEEFIRKYPYTFQGPTLENLRLDLGI